MSEKRASISRSLRSQSPSKRRSLVATSNSLHRPFTPPPPANTLKKSKSASSKDEFSAPIPVLEPSAPYKVSPKSDTSSNTKLEGDASQPPQQVINVKVVAIGDGNTGKTCLLVTYANGTFPEAYVPTVFENYLTKVKGPNGKLIELALWDTAGQEEYDRLRALSYPEVNVLLVCYAIDQPASLDNVYDKWIPEITHYCPDIPFILVGLKTDLRSDMTALQHLQSKGQRPITAEEGKKAASACGAFKYMECSAKNRHGINEIFNEAIRIVIHDKKPTSRKVSERRELPRPPANAVITENNNTYIKPKPKKRSKCVIL